MDVMNTITNTLWGGILIIVGIIVYSFLEFYISKYYYLYRCSKIVKKLKKNPFDKKTRAELRDLTKKMKKFLNY